jgi:hypothetical protein
MLVQTSVHRILTDAGWSLWAMGGNTTNYGRTLEGGSYEQLDLGDGKDWGGTVPTRMDDPVAVYRYEDPDAEEATEVRTFPTLRDFLSSEA